MRRYTAFAAALLLSAASLAIPTFASAQTALTPVATSCGSRSYTNGETRPLTQDVTGVLCTNATGSGTGSGSTTDPACATDTGDCSLIALIKRNNQLNTSVLNSTDPVAVTQSTSPWINAGSGDTAGAVPSKAVYQGANSSSTLVGVTQGDASAAVSISTATTTQVIALSGSKVTHVTYAHLEMAGTGNWRFVYGTGSNCGTGTTNMMGDISWTAQSGFSGGGGLGPILVVPAGKALCITTSAAVQLSGWLTYTQP